MKLFLLFGPHAVGKMTIGQELEKITGLPLFHNHMTIDIVAPFFSYSNPEGKRLVNLFRQEIFTTMAQSDQAGMIFTYVWNFDVQDDWDYIENLRQLFANQGATVYFIELEASLEERLQRNRHPHRLHHKPTKRDLTFSEKNLRESMIEHRLNSEPGEITYDNYIRINTTNITPKDTALKIAQTFSL